MNKIVKNSNWSGNPNYDMKCTKVKAALDLNEYESKEVVRKADSGEEMFLSTTNCIN